LAVDELNVMQKMKKPLAILTVILALNACDPIYVGELRNYTDTEIEISVCGGNLSYVNYNNIGSELPQKDSAKNCKTIKLDKNQVMPIVTASGIAEPITYEDLSFDQIEINTNYGQIRATGQVIMSLFKVEEKRNFIGIHTYDLYHIDVGQKKEK